MERKQRGRGGIQSRQAAPRGQWQSARGWGAWEVEYCLCRAGDGGGLEFRARLSMEPGGWSPSESELPDREPGLEMSQKKKKTHTKNRARKGELHAANPQRAVRILRAGQPHPRHLLNEPGSNRAWEGHGCLQGLPALADDIPAGANLLLVKNPPVQPSWVHGGRSFGRPEAWRARGGEGQCGARGWLLPPRCLASNPGI